MEDDISNETQHSNEGFHEENGTHHTWWSKQAQEDVQNSVIAKYHEAAHSRQVNEKVEMARQQEWYARNDMEAHFAAATGNTKLLNFLCKTKAYTINKQDTDYKTPLMHAVVNGHLEAVTILLNARAKINLTDHRGFTALHMAVRHDKVKLVKTLLSAGAKASAKDKEGRYPIHFATQCSTIKPLVELLKAPVKNHVNLKDNNLMTPLHWACYYRQPNHVAALVMKKAKQDLLDLEKRTPLHWACLSGSPMCANHLLRSGSAHLINLKDRSGNAPILLAAGNGHHNIIKVLSRVEGVDIDITDTNGRTAMHWATASHNDDVVLALLDVGAHPCIRDKLDKSPLDYAVAANSDEKLLSALSDAVHQYHNHEYKLHKERTLHLADDATLQRLGISMKKDEDVGTDGLSRKNTKRSSKKGSKKSETMKVVPEEPSEPVDININNDEPTIAEGLQHHKRNATIDTSSSTTSSSKANADATEIETTPTLAKNIAASHDANKTQQGEEHYHETFPVTINHHTFTLQSQEEADDLESMFSKMRKAEKRLRKERNTLKREVMDLKERLSNSEDDL